MELQDLASTATLPTLLRHARGTYGRVLREALTEAGYDDVPANGLYVIGLLAAANSGVPVGRLAIALGITKQGVGQLVDRLVETDYVVRTPDPADRRQLLVTLSPRGAAAAAVQADARGRVDTALMAKVGRADLGAARRVLAALIALDQAEHKGAASGSRGSAEGRTFRGQRLGALAFLDCGMPGTRFNDVDLAGADFENVRLKGARFHDVDLSNVSIYNAKITGATLFGHELSDLIERAASPD